MMLAGLRDYMHPWQPVLFLSYLGVWLIGGCYLTRWALRRFTELRGGRLSLGRCAKVNLLAGGAALAATAIVLGFFLALAMRVGPRKLVLGGVVLAPLVMLIMSWAVHAALLNVPGKAAFCVSGVTAVTLLVLLAAFGLAGFLPAWEARQETINRDFCHGNLLRLHGALESHGRRFPGREAPDLKTLVTKGFTEAKYLVCPGRPEEEVGYLYQPSPRSNGDSQKIRICDRRGNHGQLRLVLFTDGRVLPVAAKEFEQILALPENAKLRQLDAADR